MALLTDDQEKQIRQGLLMVGLDLRGKQGFWETPRNIAILLAAVAAIAGAVGFQIGQSPQLITITIQNAAPAQALPR